jgi:signal transduction histidine kinase/ligand-binding sensor domain-containing protein/DNA-binding response OmpR family regulator
MRENLKYWFILLWVPFHLHAQTRHLGIVQGLSNNYVLSISQDSEGLIWLATEDGLNRFNGKSFKVFRKSEGGISANELNKVFADESGVWIATQRAGLLCLDPKSETFRKYVHDAQDPESLMTNDVTDISPSSQGFLWIATYHRGVAHMDKTKGTFSPLQIENLPEDKTWAVREDPKGYLYIGHASQGLSIVRLKDKSVTRIQQSQGLPGNTVRAIFIDHLGHVWIGTNEGLALFRNGEIKAYKGLGQVYSIGQLADGRLWIATEKSGLHFLDLRQNLDPTKIKFESVKELEGKSIRTVLQDKFQNLWVGSYGNGVYFLPHRKAYFKNYRPQKYPTAWGLAIDENNRLWAGTDGGGIDVLGVKNIQLPDNAVISAFRDRLGQIWIGTFKGGAYSFSSQGQKLSHLEVAGVNKDIRCFFEDQSGQLWIGTSSGLLHHKSNTLYTTENSGLSSNLVRAGLQDRKGNYWIGTFGDGLLVLDAKMQRVKEYRTDMGFPSNTVNHLLEDRKGNIWVASGEGLVRFSPNGDMKVYQESLHNQHIRAIVEDEAGDIWFSTIAGISKYVRNSEKIINYWGHEGMPKGDFMSGSVAQDANGFLYFGSQEGVCYFHPSQVPAVLPARKPVFTDFNVYDNLAQNRQKIIPLQNEVTLSHNENTFTVGFNTLDFAQEGVTEYAYSLEGLNEQWYNTEGETYVTFRNLSPGDYTLRIKSGIKDQGWGEDYATMEIRIQPPFWASWWAKLLYLGLAATIIVYVLRFYARKMELENSLLIEKRDHQKDQELHLERIRFFTNITHELRTPLTLILGPLEDLLKEKTLSEAHKSKVSVIHKSSLRLLALINQILDFQKTQSQLRKLNLIPGDLSLAVYEIGKKYQELNRNEEILFELQVPEWNEKIYFDEEVLHIVLENLLSNAFKYTQKGEIRLQLQKEKDTWVKIQVSDTGKGIPPASLDKIFERYYQVEEDSKVSGTGIGLALVKSLVELHLGKIEVSSELGKGTTFTVYLPYKTPVKNEEKSSDKPQILVVEDHSDLRDYIAETLKEKFQVIVASNGQEGLRLAKEHMPDLIITDLMMPVMDGMSLSRKLREDINTSHIPIVLLTAKDSTDDRIKGYELGIASYLTKPFSAQLVISRIENLLEAQRKLVKEIKETGETTPTLSAIDKEFLSKVKQRIEANLEMEKLDVEFLAAGMHMSHSTLYRKIKALTGGSVNEFIRKVKMQKAAEYLSTGEFTVSEVAFKVGISSMLYFRQCFKEEFGTNPSEFIKKSKT